MLHFYLLSLLLTVAIWQKRGQLRKPSKMKFASAVIRLIYRYFDVRPFQLNRFLLYARRATARSMCHPSDGNNFSNFASSFLFQFRFSKRWRVFVIGKSIPNAPISSHYRFGAYCGSDALRVTSGVSKSQTQFRRISGISTASIMVKI